MRKVENNSIEYKTTWHPYIATESTLLAFLTGSPPYLRGHFKNEKSFAIKAELIHGVAQLPVCCLNLDFLGCTLLTDTGLEALAEAEASID